MNPYCFSRYQAKRRTTRVVSVGGVEIGGDNPIRVQSMTTTNTMDVDATVKQSIELAEAGCEIVRITAPSQSAARALQEIRNKLNDAKIHVPLVADIHFLPSAAMEAVEHVEKVRVNPGNYADKKRFKTREYSDSQYNEELERLHEAFSPLVLRAKELGRALRIGTNHGSLSDRIMNRYGDSPLGMVESALEFIRICESHNYHGIILSMKASNPKVMIEAYRLAVAKMAEENMAYPLHLGVTEAGDGEDARIKSAVGIGSLLSDGLGDTIRVSLTEDPVYEVPVARALADKAHALWEADADESEYDSINPYEFTRRLTIDLKIDGKISCGATHPPRVIIPLPHPPSDADVILSEIKDTHSKLRDTKIEGLLIKIDSADEFQHIPSLHSLVSTEVDFLILDIGKSVKANDAAKHDFPHGTILLRTMDSSEELSEWVTSSQSILAVDAPPSVISIGIDALKAADPSKLIITSSSPEDKMHAVGTYRKIIESLRNADIKAPIWIRGNDANRATNEDYFSSRILDHSILAGSLLCDGVGDLLSIETEDDSHRATGLAWNVLQGAKARISKTEYVACPSCGRTLFDLQSTTQKIRGRTGHLKNVTIAVMGCIVNGPGEMADADFGYVGGAPNKVNLYVGKECVKKNIPESEAVERLVDLIKEHNMWIEPVLENS